MRADLIFSETKFLIEKFYKVFSHPTTKILHFPNCRNENDYSLDFSRKYNPKKMLFVGTISEAKGVDLLLKVQKELPDIEIDYYGMIEDASYTSRIGDSYCGIFQPGEFRKILKEHSFLLLPTQWYGEGYPGVVVEAFACGLPVIASHFRAIPELVIDGENGFLVNISNEEALIKLMSSNMLKNLSQESYSDMCKNARQFFLQQLNSDINHHKFFSALEDL
ncbi:glycosyltransferase family 4 protein [Planktomarina temperata]|nr:glycosyltransferase family 4 protein [Planktomarina temperata]